MTDVDRLIQLLARLPGLGPRSARRAALSLLKKRESLMEPLAHLLTRAVVSIKACSRCGNLDDEDVAKAAAIIESAGGREATLAEAQRCLETALGALDGADLDSGVLDELEQVARFVVDRDA